MMTTETKDQVNLTDASVVFDPSFKQTIVIKKWAPPKGTIVNGEDKGILNTYSDQLKIDGIQIPIVMINNNVIDNADIISVQIVCDGFKPYAGVLLSNRDYLRINTPNKSTKMTIIMLPPENGTYKKISIDFHILNVRDQGDSVLYWAEYYCIDLNKRYTKMIKPSSISKPNTYQVLEQIAKDCKLGFACTQKCVDVNDTRPRLMHDQTYEEFILEHISFSGIDGNSILTTWIDVFGYLVLCNLSWVLSQSVDINKLMINMVQGINFTAASIPEDLTIHYTDASPRIFTNYKYCDTPLSNIIRACEWEIDNTLVKACGTDNTYYILAPKSSGKYNTVDAEKTIITGIESNPYEYNKNQFLGTEMGCNDEGNTPTIYQTKLRESYLAKRRYKRLKVTLSSFNPGLERGQLIGILLFEYDYYNKSRMLAEVFNTPLNSVGDTSIAADNSTETHNYTNILNDERIGIPNYAMSGVYYIDAIKYYYNYIDRQIVQTLFLIKQAEMPNIVDL